MFLVDFDDAVDNLDLLRHIGYENTAVFRFLYKAELYFEEPHEVISQLLPLPHGIHYYSNHTHYSWDIKTSATSVGSDSIILEFEDIPTKNLFLLLDNVMWFSLGLGIPLFISSLFELLRLKEDLRQNQVFTNVKSMGYRKGTKGKNEVDKKTKSSLILFFIIEILFIAIFGATYAIASAFPDYIKVQGTIDLMNALVAVDGVLMGFVGIVYAQLLSAIMNQQNTIFAKMLSTNSLKEQSRYDNFLKVYSKRKKFLVAATIITFAFLLASIIYSLVGLARVSMYDPTKDTYAPFGLTFLPIFFIVEAVAMLVIALVGIPTEPPKRDEGKSQTTL